MYVRIVERGRNCLRFCVVSALNPCDYDNGGCEQKCIRELATAAGQLGYRCSCEMGVLAPDKHTCVSSGECAVHSVKAKAKAYNTYIVPQAAAAAALLCHRQSDCTAYRP